MNEDPLLSPQEIDALLTTVTEGGLGGSGSAGSASWRAESFDFNAQHRPLGSRLPMLTMINERFADSFNGSLGSMLRRASKVQLKGTILLGFADYQHSLASPAYISFIHIKPLRGTAMVVLDAPLVVMAVDHFFGGSGRRADALLSSDFTPTEKRLAHLLLQRIFADLKQAWSTVLAIEFESVRTETQAEFADILNPSEPLMLSTFAIDVEGSTGQFQLVIPCAMLEPVRRQLETTYPAEDSPGDQRWLQVLSEEMEVVRVPLTSTLARVELPLSQVLALEVGDVIGIEMPEQVALNVEGIPLFRGEFGASNGKHAVKIQGRIARPGEAR